MRKKGPGNIHGFFLVDKPEGVSSALVVSKVKKHFDLFKIGHTGTLDPFASGLLVLAIGHATKLSDYFLKGSKSYLGLVRFGQKTDSLDRTGVVLDKAGLPSIFSLQESAKFFQGEIKQKPPMYSAVKVGGERLYKKARRGEMVEREERKVFIESFEIKSLAQTADQLVSEAEIKVTCGGGTYIRSLASDWAEKSGSFAYLERLRRIHVKAFQVEDASTLENLGDTGGDLKALPSFISFSDPRLDFIHRVPVEDEVIDRLKRGDQSPLESPSLLGSFLLNKAPEKGSFSFLLNAPHVGAALVVCESKRLSLKKVLA